MTNRQWIIIDLATRGPQDRIIKLKFGAAGIIAFR